MDKEFRWKLIMVAVVIAFGLFFAIPWDRPLFKGKMRFGLDLQGGTELLYRLKDLPPEQAKKHAGEDLAGTIIGIIKQRIDAQGVKQPRIQKQGNNRILIQLPGADEEETGSLRKLILTSGNLKFRLVAKPDFAKQHQGKPAPRNHEWLEYAREEDGREKELVMINDGYVLGGEIIEKAFRDSDEIGFPAVGFKIRRGLQNQFRNLTSNNSEESGRGRRMAIIMDNKIISAPMIKSTISTQGVITGGEKGFSLEDQGRLITVLNSGRFPVGLEEESINQVGPGIGSDSIQKGTRAILVAGVVVLLFMALYYLGSGIVANFALCLNLALILAAMNLISATMTLPGIAGILLTVGMAVDANILIFERIREEKDKGKTLHQALKTGYERATITIIDANVTTLITAAILWLVGTGPVRGFAVTLSVGILASMFTAIFVTRVIFELLLMGRVITRFKMFQIVKDPDFGFIRWAGKAILASALFLAVGLLFFSYRGEKNLGIDFREGTVVDFNLKKAIPISEVRKRVTGHARQTDTGTLYPYRVAEIQELWRGVGVTEKSVAHSFEVRTGWAEKPESVRGDLERIFSGDLVPAPFENAQGIESVSNTSFAFSFFYNLKVEKAVRGMEKAFLRSFQNYLPEAFGEDKTALPGTLKGAGYDEEKRSHTKKLVFESGRIRADWNLAEIQAKVNAFVVSVRADLLGQVECEFDGEFPYDPPKIERFADLALTLQFIKEVKPAEVHEAFKNFPAVKITPAKSGAPTKSFVLQTEEFRQEGGDTSNPWEEQLGNWKERVREAIRDKNISSNLSEPISRSVGISPIVAGELIEKGVLAIIFSLVAIVLYVAIRFQVGSTAQQFQGSGLLNLIKEMLYRARYGIAAIAALVHDVFFTMGVLAICGTLGIIDVKIDLQILAAFLTIIGYSLNDTIVVFDRIRENLNAGEKMAFRDVVNRSINQTLGRTLLTSGTTFFVMLSLFLLGGGTIHGFSFTLLIGVVVGTYSSIYVASPVLLFWEKVVRPTSG